MVTPYKFFCKVYFKDGGLEIIEIRDVNSVTTPTCTFVEFHTKRGLYGYITTVNSYVDENCKMMIRPYVYYLKYDYDNKEWKPTEDVDKVLTDFVEIQN